MQVTKEAIRQMAKRGEDITQLDVSHLTDMSELFYDKDGWDVDEYISPLKNFNQDLSSWDVSQVTNMDSMFDGCSSFNQDISGWDVSKVTSMFNMFTYCSSFNQDLSSWDVSRVTNMAYLFAGCFSFNQDLSGWDVSHVNNMECMFYNCHSFNQDLSIWNVVRVTMMYGMFYGCDSLTHNQYWNLHPDCEDVPEQVQPFPDFNQELKHKILHLLKGYTFTEAINQVLADPTTSNKKRYTLLKFQQKEQVKELTL